METWSNVDVVVNVNSELLVLGKVVTEADDGIDVRDNEVKDGVVVVSNEVVVSPAVVDITFVEVSVAEEVVVDGATLVLEVRLPVAEVSPTDVVISIVELLMDSVVVSVVEVSAADVYISVVELLSDGVVVSAVEVSTTDVVLSIVEVPTAEVVVIVVKSDLVLDVDETSNETVVDIRFDVDGVIELSVEEDSIVLEAPTVVELLGKDIDVKTRELEVEVASWEVTYADDSVDEVDDRVDDVKVTSVVTSAEDEVVASSLDEVGIVLVDELTISVPLEIVELEDWVSKLVVVIEEEASRVVVDSVVLERKSEVVLNALVGLLIAVLPEDVVSDSTDDVIDELLDAV